MYYTWIQNLAVNQICLPILPPQAGPDHMRVVLACLLQNKQSLLSCTSRWGPHCCNYSTFLADLSHSSSNLCHHSDPSFHRAVCQSRAWNFQSMTSTGWFLDCIIFSVNIQDLAMTYRMPTMWPISWANVWAVSCSVSPKDVMLRQEYIVEANLPQKLAFWVICALPPSWLYICSASTANSGYAFYMTFWYSWKVDDHIDTFHSISFNSKIVVRFHQGIAEKQIKRGEAGHLPIWQHFLLAWKVAILIWGFVGFGRVNSFNCVFLFDQSPHHFSAWPHFRCNMLNAGNL